MTCAYVLVCVCSYFSARRFLNGSVVCHALNDDRLHPLPQSRSVLHTGDVEGARKYGRLSMLLSCLAILLGVAVIIFIVLTLGMEESQRESRAQKGLDEKMCA